MKWMKIRVDGNDGPVRVFRSPDGHEVWEDFEWEDREWSEEKNQYVGPMKKKIVWMGKSVRGQHVGPFQSRREAQGSF